MTRSTPILSLLALFGAACATEGHRVVATPTVAAAERPYDGPRHPIVVGTFQNASSYMRGLFSDGQDRLGGQAKTILKTHLTQTNRFVVLDRDQAPETAREAELAGQKQVLEGAKVVLSGEVTEFGRRETGDKQLFGILGHGKEQLAYAKVSINVIDVRSSRVIHAVEGAAEYTLDNREVLGFGGTAAYDSTLNGKVLNLAITDAVNKLVADLEHGAWSPEN